MSYLQGNLAIINSFIVFILLFLYITLTADMYVTIKRIKEREKVEVPNEFRVDAFKQTHIEISFPFFSPLFSDITFLTAKLSLIFVGITNFYSIFQKIFFHQPIIS